MISGIIKVEESVIIRGPKAEADNTNRDLDYFGYHKNRIDLIIVLLYIVSKQITTNTLSHRTQFVFDTPCSCFAVRELDIALGNHALSAQPTDYSLICRYRLVNNL